MTNTDTENDTETETDVVSAETYVLFHQLTFFSPLSGDTNINLLSAVSRFDLERAREEADEKKGRAERARQEYGVQVSYDMMT